MVYYNQADTRWSSHYYTSASHPNATLKSSGCGPTSGAIIISNLVKNVLPNDMADEFKNNGFRAEEGTSLSAFTWLAKKYNLKCEETSDLNNAVNCLKRGGMVVASCNQGLFSTGGHLIVLAYMKDNDTITVYDPYLYNGKFNQLGRQGKVIVNGNKVYCSINNFRNYANCQRYFCYEKIVDLQYKAHIQDIGWTDWKNADEVIGTTGEGKRIEAIILQGNNGIDLSYRVHIEDFGWSDWVQNGQVAGTTGQSKRIEEIEIKCNKTLEVQEHVQDVGWLPCSKGTNIRIGTEGKCLRLEAFRIRVV